MTPRLRTRDHGRLFPRHAQGHQAATHGRSPAGAGEVGARMPMKVSSRRRVAVAGTAPAYGHQASGVSKRAQHPPPPHSEAVYCAVFVWRWSARVAGRCVVSHRSAWRELCCSTHGPLRFPPSPRIVPAVCLCACSALACLQQQHACLPQSSCNIPRHADWGTDVTRAPRPSAPLPADCVLLVHAAVVLSGALSTASKLP